MICYRQALFRFRVSGFLTEYVPTSTMSTVVQHLRFCGVLCIAWSVSQPSCWRVVDALFLCGSGASCFRFRVSGFLTEYVPTSTMSIVCCTASVILRCFVRALHDQLASSWRALSLRHLSFLLSSCFRLRVAGFLAEYVPTSAVER